MIRSSLVVANGKGGCGKTSIAANVAASLALADGWRVLLIDLDPQAHLSLALGVEHRSRAGGRTHDFGESLKLACMTGGRVTPEIVADVRPGLDLIPGGPDHLSELRRWLGLKVGERQRDEAYGSLTRALVSVADAYNLVVLDTGPAAKDDLSYLALATARWLVAPMRPYDFDLSGIHLLADMYGEITGDVNPDLEFLGVVLFALDPRATAIDASVRRRVDEVLGPQSRVFTTAVRHGAAAAKAADAGLLAYEHEQRRQAAERERLLALRQRRRLPRGGSFGANAAQLADD
jgi:cellulose biosynthesis protein BcsQ